MKFNFKKISAIATSALLTGMTMGVAAAASYPAPFVVGGTADVAVVYGTGTGVSTLDLIQSGNIQTDLQAHMGTAAVGAITTTSGEVAELFTGGTKIYISDALNKVKDVLTKSNLPTALADQSFSGNVDATVTQTIVLGANPNITYEKQPTSSDEPDLGLKLSTSASNAAFNLTATFSKSVNFSHADSEGEDITMFGITYTVSAATDGDDLILLKSAEKLSLDSNNPTADVTVGGETYTIELVSASDSAATVKVTDSTGASEQKEIDEAQSKKISGITIAVTTADETNLKLSASIVAGSEKVTFTDSTYVKVGESDTAILGTDVDFHGGSPGAGLSKLTISITAEDSDVDALKVGESFVDPVFGAVKLTLGGFNIGTDDTASREEIKIENSGDERMQITFADYNGVSKTIQYANYKAGGTNASLFINDDLNNMSVRERENLHRNDYVILGNEDEGNLLRLTTVTKSISAGTTASGDKCTFTNMFSGDSHEVTFTSNTSTISTGTMVVGGKSYTVYVEGLSNITTAELYNVSINYPDSGTAGHMIAFPTIETSKGAKIAFYEPLNVSADGWTGNDTNNNLTGILLPNGADTYQTITLAYATNMSNASVTCVSTTVNNVTQNDAVSCNITNTGFGYNLLYDDGNEMWSLYLRDHSNANIMEPAIMIFEEKDDNNNYEGLIVITESGATSEDGIGVSDVERTWTDDSVWDSTTMYSDSKQEKEIDLWGTVIQTDKGDSDQAIATISYPDEQVYALLYMSEETASITTTGATTATATQLGDVLVKDTEISSVSSKNLIVVGGSCINSAAAKVLGVSDHTCGAAFTTATGVGSGEFLIKGVSGAYTTGKIALVVAGYEAADTVNAATYLRNQVVDTSKEYKGTSSTSATLVTTEA